MRLFKARTNSNEQLCIEVYKFTRDSWYQQLQALNDKNNASKLADATIEHANDNFVSNEPAPTVFTRPTFFYQIKPPANIGKVQSKLEKKMSRICQHVPIILDIFTYFLVKLISNVRVKF